jgi:hypothetical protein
MLQLPALPSCHFWPHGFGLTSWHGSGKQLLMGAQLVLKHLRHLKTPQRGFLLTSP